MVEWHRWTTEALGLVAQAALVTVAAAAALIVGEPAIRVRRPGPVAHVAGCCWDCKGVRAGADDEILIGKYCTE